MLNGVGPHQLRVKKDLILRVMSLQCARIAIVPRLTKRIQTFVSILYLYLFLFLNHCKWFIILPTFHDVLFQKLSWELWDECKYCFSSFGFHPSTPILVLLNLIAAFDTVDHDILFERLQAFAVHFYKIPENIFSEWHSCAWTQHLLPKSQFWLFQMKDFVLLCVCLRASQMFEVDGTQ